MGFTLPSNQLQLQTSLPLHQARLQKKKHNHNSNKKKNNPPHIYTVHMVPRVYDPYNYFGLYWQLSLFSSPITYNSMFSWYQFEFLWCLNTPVQLPSIALMEQFVWLVGQWRMLAEWRSASMECGEEFVVITGTIVIIPWLCAGNWGTMSTQEEVSWFSHWKENRWFN